MASVDEATWHEQAHIRCQALEYALTMVRSDILTTDNYIAEAGKYWQFLRDGTVPLAQAANLLVMPDDVSGIPREPRDWAIVEEAPDDTEPPFPDPGR